MTKMLEFLMARDSFLLRDNALVFILLAHRFSLRGEAAALMRAGPQHFYIAG